MTETFLELQVVEVSYGQVGTLGGVNLAILKGRIASLLDGNASGEPTTVKTILGPVHPDAGRALLSGKDITTWPTSRGVAPGIASIPEAHRIFAPTTVEENLLLGAYTRYDRTGIRDDLAAQYDCFPRLRQRRRQAAGTTSGGEQQMLAFARALISRPRLICMDEPAVGLSPRLVDEALETIVALNTGPGLAVLMTEQQAELALSIAHHGYVLTTGNLTLKGPTNELSDNPRIQEACLGYTTRSGDDDDDQT